jgi:outer membrane immunogenic protein
MKTMHAGLLGLTLTCAFALTANATDVYRGGMKDGPAPAYVVAPAWNGLYGGLNVGYGWTADDSTNLLSPSGVFGGGQIGYNWQGALGLSPRIVLGIEADLQTSGISDSASFDGVYAENNLNWFGTVRGRLGYAVDRALFYVTGGFAFGEVEGRVDGLSLTSTQTGYALGGGVEYKFNPAWSVKGEYQYLNLDANDSVGPLGVGLGDRSEVHTVRLGVNYHLAQGGYGPLN